ncbi:MAG: tRNA preQ1(34) S-adenosylmethionine ribosyltransferase-isomerase QueA [Chloroflexi bacterium]|nr:tRNA preQ1(34) S-adenosylmethionine ribosyltransferase-isomerase QueA [Chloroflexota bacterium]
MRTSDFDYPLPRELIAQTPVEPRDHSRLLVLDRQRDALDHRHFYDLPDLLRPGDLLVCNDTRVMPARLYGRRADTGGRVELLLVRRQGTRLWSCLARPAKRLRPGARLVFAQGLEATVREADADGFRLVELNGETLLHQVGQVPLPPYIHTPLQDPERYQTVYAGADQGSVAAPTAGLHFTPALLDRVNAMGIRVAFVTLHVGPDTFRPVKAEDPLEHKLSTEHWELPAETAELVNRARGEGRRIVAVGTTTVRTLEQAALLSEAQGAGDLQSGSGWADLFILPGYRFRVVDTLITNFHLPRTTLLMLVCAFAGRERILAAYQEAARLGYRFYSFGDGMVVV